MPDIDDLPRLFALHRRYDLTGGSGTGVIAYGTRYPSGRVTLAWRCSDVRSVSVYDDIADVEQIHGHNGLTDVRWIDPPTSAMAASDRPVVAAPTAGSCCAAPRDM
ncbi:hypothetical protein CLV30_11564 [Haloactinopolyspora alba]|uniref:Uncharacterized protein n=2 Tax=Haloactinopolyspora alba TaxID=648780 RepID=A0A2P8DV66_9ACTN|nr:hypothetical protein CLV30_11564 [Haloactinopolyspora alba]